MKVYLVHFRSSGEIWHTAVCEDEIAVDVVLKNYGITQKVHDGLANMMQYLTTEYVKPGDGSQTALVVLRRVILGKSR